MECKLTFKDYNEALKANKLMGLKCQDCGAVLVPPKLVCRECAGSNMEVVELKGTGKIQTFTTCNVAPEGRENEIPYTILLVELDEGPWVMGNLTGTDPAATSMEMIGQRVKMAGSAIFTGDRYSAGDSARPLFSLE
jgi:uncharacterized OB-fold protein